LKEKTEAASAAQEEYKPWKYMTEADINQIKVKNCCSCAYSIGPNGVRKDNYVKALTCNYISDVGHRRPCRPEKCRERGVWRKKK
jgi:hypothetical protein